MYSVSGAVLVYTFLCSKNVLTKTAYKTHVQFLGEVVETLAGTAGGEISRVGKRGSFGGSVCIVGIPVIILHMRLGGER